MTSSSSLPIFVIAGCTATGKSQIALDVATRFGGEIFNADSRQIYTGMTIGTSSPVPDLQQRNVGDRLFTAGGIPHHLYNFLSPDEQYNIARYRNDLGDALSKTDKLPILVGGAGLYIDSFIFNYKTELEEIDYEKRAELEEKSIAELQGMIEPEALAHLNSSDAKNPRRLIRIIEGRDAVIQRGESVEHLYIVVEREKEELNHLISVRASQMVKDGLIEENRDLLDAGFRYGECAALNTIGYKEFAGYFEGQKSIEEVIAQIELHTRQYAKRQRTWFRRHTEAKRVSSSREAIELVQRYLENR